MELWCQQICISPAPGRSLTLTHIGVDIDTCAFQTDRQLSSAASGMSLMLCFWHNFSGMKRTCWTTGSWRRCWCLEIVSSIPAGSTIIYRFLCGFICFSLCQSIRFKPTNIHTASFNPSQLKHRNTEPKYVTLPQSMIGFMGNSEKIPLLRKYPEIRTYKHKRTIESEISKEYTYTNRSYTKIESII